MRTLTKDKAKNHPKDDRKELNVWSIISLVVFLVGLVLMFGGSFMLSFSEEDSERRKKLWEILARVGIFMVAQGVFFMIRAANDS